MFGDDEREDWICIYWTTLLYWNEYFKQTRKHTFSSEQSKHSRTHTRLHPFVSDGRDWRRIVQWLLSNGCKHAVNSHFIVCASVCLLSSCCSTSTFLPFSTGLLYYTRSILDSVYSICNNNLTRLYTLSFIYSVNLPFFLVLRIYNCFCVCPCLRYFTLQFAHSDSVVDHPSGRRLLYTTYAIVVNQLLLCLSSAYSHCPDSLLFNVCMLFCVRLRVGLVPIQSMRGCWAHVYSVFSFTEWWWWWWRGAYYSSSSVCTALRRRVLSCLSFRVSLHRGHCDHYRRLLCKPSRSLLLHHCAINFSGHGSSYFSTSVTWTWTFPYLSYLFHSWARYLLIACVHVWASVSLVVREPPTWFGRRLPHLIWSRIVRCLFISQGE